MVVEGNCVDRILFGTMEVCKKNCKSTAIHPLVEIFPSAARPLRALPRSPSAPSTGGNVITFHVT